MQVYFGDWEAPTTWVYEGPRQGHNEPVLPKQAMEESFNLEEPLGDDVEVLFAEYTQESYEGSAFVLFRRDGKLYEVNAGHCSCYGLEGQWIPEEAVLAELRHRNEPPYPIARTEEGQARLAELLKELGGGAEGVGTVDAAAA